MYSTTSHLLVFVFLAVYIEYPNEGISNTSKTPSTPALVFPDSLIFFVTLVIGTIYIYNKEDKIDVVNTNCV